MTFKEICDRFAQFLSKQGIGNAREEVLSLAAHLLHCSRHELILRDFEIDIDQLLEMVERRGRGEPFAYIVGSVVFLEATIDVDRSVLIPRVETELLAERVSNEIKKGRIRRLLDLCTGSGAIAIALKKRHSDLEVFGADISEEALSLARKNATQNGVEVTFSQGDLFEAFPDMTFDAIVCNPPYISNDEYESISREVKDYEPSLALFASEEGTFFYRKIAEKSLTFLNKRGFLWLEIGSSLGEKVSSFFKKDYSNLKIEKDLAGLDRYITCNKP